MSSSFGFTRGRIINLPPSSIGEEKAKINNSFNSGKFSAISALKKVMCLHYY
jgi:hypothetical protein